MQFDPLAGGSQVMLTEYIRVFPLRVAPDDNDGAVVLPLGPKGASTYSLVMNGGSVSFNQRIFEADVA